MLKSNKFQSAETPISPCESCLICLSSLEKSTIRGQLPCGHSQFCIQCILGWAEVTNKCPVCQGRFLFIHSCRPSRAKLSLMDRIEVEERDQGGFILGNLNIPCKHCGSDAEQDRLLLCDRCGEGVHSACLGMDEYPQLEEWYCDSCLVYVSKNKQLKQWKHMKEAGRQQARRSLRLRRRLN